MLIAPGTGSKLFGYGGDDILIGGDGADEFYGGEGWDLVDYSDSDAAITVSTYSAPTGLGGDAEGDRYRSSIEGMLGSEFDDGILFTTNSCELHGQGGNDTLSGSSSDDFIYGEAGNDAVQGYKGNDILDGGEGIDTVLYSNHDYYMHVVNLSAGTAISTYIGGTSPSHPQYVDQLSNFENVVTSHQSDTIIGDAGDNSLTSGTGSDILIGGAGSDTLTGDIGAGYVYNYSDRFTYVSLEDSPGTTTTGGTVTTYAGSEADVITDFRSGYDLLAFESDAFAGPVYNTDQIADLNLATADDSAFAFSDSELFYVHYASEEDYLAGIATVHDIAMLTGITSLTDSDLLFV